MILALSRPSAAASRIAKCSNPTCTKVVTYIKSQCPICSSIAYCAACFSKHIDKHVKVCLLFGFMHLPTKLEEREQQEESIQERIDELQIALILNQSEEEQFYFAGALQVNFDALENISTELDSSALQVEEIFL